MIKKQSKYAQGQEVMRDWPLRSAIAVFLCAVAVMFAAVTYVATPVYAANGDGLSKSGSRFVRIGLNKSIVVRLPANARDVLIGNPKIADAIVRTQRTAYLFAKEVGQTNAFFFDAEGRQILSLDIEVSLDMKSLSKLLRRAIPGSGITVDTIGDSVVLGGTAANAAQAKTAVDLATRFVSGKDGSEAAAKVVSTISITGKDQVMLRVRIAELQRDVLKQFGIDTTTVFQVSNFTANLTNLNPFAIAGALNGSNYQANYASGGNSVNAIIRAMENDGLLRTLAEPTLTAVSGENAKFLAGGEFPVPVGRDDNGITIEFKPFGVGLGFTPVVMSEGRISLRINTEVSELSNENGISVGNAATSSTITIPALKVRRAETTVELPSGGSLIMAGLMQERTKQNLVGIPGVKNLPVLGALFRSRDFQASQTELVVIVTPFVVNPVNDKQLVTPLDHLNTATDRQTIFFGRLNKVYGVGGQNPKGTYHGNVGFIVE